MKYEQFIPLVAIFDTNPILSEGVAALLSHTGAFEGQPMTIADTSVVSLPSGFCPDVILIDPAQTDLSAGELMARLSGPGDPIAVLGYASVLDAATVKTCLAAGFRGFLPKTATLAVLQSAIHAVISGGIYLDACAAKVLVPDNVGPAHRPSSDDVLSGREKDVLRSVAMGMSMKEIGSAMALSAKTIETYKARASNKLNLQTRSDIVNFAIRSGWVKASA